MASPAGARLSSRVARHRLRKYGIPLFLALYLLMVVLRPHVTQARAIVRSLPLPREGAQPAWLVYDGECPFCRNYARYLDIREAVGDLILVDAREGGPLVEEIQNLPYDLNEGMVLKMDGRYYFSNEALHLLALLSRRRGWFSIANRLLVGSPRAARLAYPVLKLGRRLALEAKNVPMLPAREAPHDRDRRQY